MALNHQYFSLARGLATVWQGTEHFDDAKKRLIIGSIEDVGEHESPQGEHQLEKLQIAIVASDYLKSLETEDSPSWLTEDAAQLPVAYKKFMHEVAFYFHQSDSYLPAPFLASLSNYIRESKSHIATLNYDNLLYDGLKDHGVLSGFDLLIDGFTRGLGFSSHNLDRHRPRTQAWYMHLHGSPLYQGNRKLLCEERNNVQGHEKSHIVLTHVKHKPMIIDSSPILSEYWRRLPTALNEVSCVVLIGYSGEDVHLNRKILEHSREKNIHIIEYLGSGTRAERRVYWARKLPNMNITLHQPESILEFVDWFALE
ncbi:SIR2 family protein [Moritella sp. 24]|uniref:SIR2 family protein n=1 Tax=Moritella sp. 24 TaxID=2746230 RepID=UPI001BA9D0BD|nr:SIR2 family protein [Moritella sp. 24]QUM75523.1 SIR2 family protein [Moritella sp. 24]